MSHTDIKATYGAFVEEAYPSARNFRRHTYGKVSGTSGHRCWTVLWFATPFPDEGANVTRATLTLRLRENSNTSHRLTVELAGEWSSSFWQLDWDHKPAGAGHRVDVSRSGTLRRGDVWQIDITDAMQAVADGQRFYGILIWSDLSGDSILFDLDGDSRPSLSMDWWTNPLPPTDLEPSGGVSATPTPVLRWSYTDHAGDTSLAAIRVQTASTQTGFDAPSWDSGTVPATACRFDTASANGFPAPDSGSTLWWRVRVQDGSGLWSGWSTPASYSYRARPSVALINPDPGTGVVTDPTPPISWRYSAGDGGGEDHWRVVISRWSQGRWHEVASSGVVHSAATRWTPGTPMTIDGVYQVVVDCWDGLAERVATPGWSIYGRASTTFRYTPTGATVAPSGLEVTAERSTPWVHLRWSRPDMPDEWIISVDGRQSVRREQAPDSGTTYTGSVLVASGPHEVQVQAVGDAGASLPMTQPVDRDLLATWLVDRETGEAVAVVGDTDHEMSMPEITATHEPLGSQRVVVVTSAQRGYEGKLAGYLVPVPGVTETPPAWRERLLAWKPLSGRVFDLVIEDYVLPVCISNIQVTSVNGQAGRLFRASLDFHQVADFTFSGDPS